MTNIDEIEFFENSKLKGMSNAELVELSINGTPSEQEDAATAIIENNVGLVVSCIKKHYPTYMARYMDDMLQEGKMAIFIHFKDYDKSKSEFSTFIIRYILDALKNYICEIHNTTPHYLKRYKDITDAVEELRNRGIENPDFGTISEQLGIGIPALQRAISVSNNANTVSIDSGNWVEREGEFSVSPEDIVEKKVMQETVRKAIEELSKGEAEVIKVAWFTSNSNFKKGDKAIPLPEVARILNMSVTDVRRYYNSGMRHLENSERLRNYDCKVSDGRLAMEKYLNSLTVQFGMDDDSVNLNVDFVLNLKDESDDEIPVMEL